MAARIRNGRWCVDFRFQGQRIRRVSSENSKQGAKKYERELRDRLARGLPLDEPGREPESPEPPGEPGREPESLKKAIVPDAVLQPGQQIRTFRQLAELFMSTKALVHNGPSERESKRGHLRTHLYPAFGEWHLDQIDLASIEIFTARLMSGVTRRGKPRSPKTINNILSTLSRILSYGATLGLLDPERKPKIELLKTAESGFDFLECGEYEKLVSAAEREPLWHAAILLGGDAGLRLGEIRALRASHHRGNRIRVERAFWRVVEKETKGKNLRTIPTSERLQDALKRLAGKDHTYLISSEKDRQLTLEAARWHLPRLCRKASIRTIGWHALRHSFCTHLAMAGVPARVIQELAGHADLQTTLRYMHLTEGASDLAVRVLFEHRSAQIEDASEKTEPETAKAPEIINDSEDLRD